MTADTAPVPELVTVEPVPTAGVRGIARPGAAEAGKVPCGRVARVVHAGSFDGLPHDWQRLGSWIVERALTPTETFREVDVTEPRPDMDPAELRTELDWLLG